MNFLVTDDETFTAERISSCSAANLSGMRRFIPIHGRMTRWKRRDQTPDGCCFFGTIQTGGMNWIGAGGAAKEDKTRYPHYFSLLDILNMPVGRICHACHRVTCLKPVTEEGGPTRNLRLFIRTVRQIKRIEIRTFGGFDVYVDGQLVRFGTCQNPRSCWLIW